MTTPATEMGIEPLVERVARAMAADQSKRLYGIDRGQDEAWEANTDYGRTELLADARAAIAAFEAIRTPEAAQVEELLQRHIQRCRDAIAQCRDWSQPQAEWSRARDALLNFRDDLAALAQVRHPSGEQSS